VSTPLADLAQGLRMCADAVERLGAGPTLEMPRWGGDEAQEAMRLRFPKRRFGARDAEALIAAARGNPGLFRAIVEEALLEVMYDIPERTDVRKCIITEETIRSHRLPLLLTKAEVDKGVDETNYETWLAERGA